ncbi:sensor histidine kinase [Vreelandella sp. EE22]
MNENTLRAAATLGADGWPWATLLLIVLALSLVLHGLIYRRSRQRLARLKRQQKALNHILWGTAAGTWEWDIQTGETRMNERWAEIVGYTLEELQPTTVATWERFCHPQELARAHQALKAHLEGKTDSYNIEFRMCHREGRDVWVFARGKVVTRDEAGAPLWMAGTHIDITQRKEAEAKAQVTTDRLTKLSARLPGAIFQYWQGVDGTVRVPYASVGVKDIYGLTPDEISQDSNRVFEVIHPDDLDKMAKSINASARTLSVWNLTFRVNHPEAGLLWIEGGSTPERLADGSTIWHGYLRDVTASCLLQQERDDYRESLEKSNRELEHFAYAASHDLRQPLRMVTSYAQLLERHLGDRLDEDGGAMLHYMSDGARRMDAMLLSLLEYSRVGRQEAPFTTFSLREPLDEALHFLAPTIAEAQATVLVQGEWPEINASRDGLTRLFQNLIGNALKYQAFDKPVEAAIAIQPRSLEGGLHITVTDNGIGIEADQIPRLFKVFQRLHSRERFEGTGVGLAICRKIVERHHGKIWVSSSGPGQGSCFHVTLPHEAPRAP